MLSAGVISMRCNALMEEVMYEKVLVSKHRIQKAAASSRSARRPRRCSSLLRDRHGHHQPATSRSPSSDPETSSRFLGGVSEPLVTTKFGLIVAILALLLHAYLARKAA